MELHYNVTKGRRKELANAISEIVGQSVDYKGIPSYEYVMGDYTVDKNGTLFAPDADSETVQNLVRELASRFGFKTESDSQDVPPTEAKSEDVIEGSREEITEDPPQPKKPSAPEKSPSETAPNGFERNLIILSLPRKNFTDGSIERLKAITASKQSLLKKALDTNTLDIQVTADQVVFPWFTNHGWDGEIDAYSKLICAMANMAIRQKRVTAVEQPCFDEKRSMRLFLIRLNFIGEKYRTAREILTRNFSNGDSCNSGIEIAESEILVNGMPMPEPSEKSADDEEKPAEAPTGEEV